MTIDLTVDSKAWPRRTKEDGHDSRRVGLAEAEARAGETQMGPVRRAVDERHGLAGHAEDQSADALLVEGHPRVHGPDRQHLLGLPAGLFPDALHRRLPGRPDRAQAHAGDLP